MKYSVTTSLTSWNVTGNDPEATLRLEVIGAYPIQFTVGSVTRDVKPFEYWDVAMRPYTVRAKGIGGSSSFRTFKQVGDAIDESDINGAVGDADVNLKKSANLSDLANKATARTNLDVYSTQEIDAKAEVSRIAIVPITGTTQTIAPNKCYTLLTNDVDAYTLTPEMPSGNPEYLLQAVVQLKTGSAAPVINWGGNPSFFNGKIPTINANSSYDVIFEFDNITLSWSVGVMKK